MTSFLSTGILSLDYALGGGWPQGRVSNLVGPRGSGRSTLALHAVAATQRAGLRALVLHNSTKDADRKYAERLGADVWPTRFDTRALLGTLVDVFEHAHAKIVPELLVVELATDKDWNSDCSADLARFLRRFCQKPRSTTPLFVHNGTIAALDYFGAVTVALSVEGDDINGDCVVTAEVLKHTASSPLRQVTLQLTPGDGIDIVKDLVRIAAYAGAVERIDTDELCARLQHDLETREIFIADVRKRLAIGSAQVPT